MPDRKIIMRTETKSILAMVGMLEAGNGMKVRIKDMNPWR